MNERTFQGAINGTAGDLQRHPMCDVQVLSAAAMGTVVCRNAELETTLGRLAWFVDVFAMSLQRQGPPAEAAFDHPR